MFTDDPDLEEFQAAIEESKLQTSVQCTPVPGDYTFHKCIIAVRGYSIISDRDLKKVRFYCPKWHTSDAKSNVMKTHANPELKWT